jgi:hypothetical protein
MLIRVDNKVVGKIENRVFYKTVDPEKHLFRIMDAWGIDFGAFKLALAKGVKKFIVIDKENNICYEADADTLLEKGIVGNFRYGEQVFLPRRLWEIKDQNQMQLL